MKFPDIRWTVAAALLTAIAIVDPAQALAQSIPISESPLFSKAQQPPLNMLVLGRDHKLFNAAYNDASDLNGDGTLDVGYKPTITYYGYFDSAKCYAYSAGIFVPQSTTATKKCPGSWSGDYLNYISTSRIDALRKVLYGGFRSVDTTTQTVLERAYIPQDGHVFGKEYQSIARDGYDIHDYTPYTVPADGKYVLFANETLISAVAASGTLRNPTAPPLMRVMANSPFRIWNWVAIEGPVGGNDCFDTNNARVDCLTGAGANGTWAVVPSSAYTSLTQSHWSLLPRRTDNQSANEADMNRLFPNSTALNTATRTLCGSNTASSIDGTGNRFKGSGGCPNNDDDYLTQFAGTINVGTAGSYQFAVDGDDAVEAYIDGTLVASWYGPHGDCAYCVTHTNGAITLAAGSHTVLFRHQELGGGDNYRLLWLTPNAGAASRDDYTVRVQVCKTGLLEDNCEKYTDSTTAAVTYKPTGLMHDYGETDKMMFGLISGSFMHNKQGGVLRKQMGSFKDEVNPNNGLFVTPKKGLIATLDGIKIQSLDSDTDPYSNPHYSYHCSAGWSTNQPDGSCRPWGNPIGEMMFETLRYFAGAGAPEPEYIYTDAGSDDNTLGMPEVATWKDPYKTTAQGGGGFLQCSKPFETVVSDVNPSYDSDLPGNAFGGTSPSGTVPAKLSGLNVSAQGQTIWNNEGYGTKNVYIGQSNATNFDAAPTAKSATSLGTLRGLSPEEPTKQGTYNAASVAFFGNTHDLSDATSDQKMQTFSVALSSPLPRIQFPINGHDITLVPFAKSVGGCIGVSPNDAFIPTNQIVGFYVEKIVNTPGQPTDATVNGGRPYAKFRISYEDAEQGNDYDMDAIVSYELSANVGNTLSVQMNSEYAAGCAIQHMGYVISGSSADGVYLEVRDKDTAATDDPRFRLDTPEGFAATGCSVTGSNNANTSCPTGPSLPLTHSRIFTPGTVASAEVLKDPLWFAAKYGGFKDANNDGLPEEGEWDANVVGTPDNYFLVTNALGLKAQLQKAFDLILANSQPVGSASASGARFVVGGSLAYQASYLATDWTGDLKAFALNSDGSLGAAPIWSASASLPAPTSRKVFTSKLSGSAFVGIPFTRTGLTAAGLDVTLMGTLNTTLYNISDVVAYLLGDQSNETTHVPAGPYRSRTTKIGDILDSTPTVAFKEGYGYQNLPVSVNSKATGSAAYQAFVTGKSPNPVVYVGANDGVLHAFDGSASGGNELFGYVPNAVIPKLNRLVQPSYVHTYFVDGTPRLGDIYDGNWKTLLIGATGAGARSVFALDVTNPNSFAASSVLWEFNDQLDNDMGVSIGVPSLPTITADGLWVTAFGNGYNSARNHAELFILDAKTGTKLSEIDTGSGGNSTSTDCVKTSGPADCPNGLSSAVMIDSDLDGTADTIYAGDYLGNLWKFTCTPDTIALSATHLSHQCTTPWKVGLGGVPLIKAQDPHTPSLRQPITSGVYAINNPLGGTIVYFGTGRYLTLSDADPNSSTLVNSIYAVWDNPNNTGTTLTRADLQQQTITSYSATTGFVGVSSNLFDYEQTFPIPASHTTSKMGWYLDLVSPASSDPMTSERVIAAPSGILGSLLVNAFRPTGDLCVPGGENTFFELNLLNGSASFSLLPGGPGTVPPNGTGGSDLGNGSPLGSPNPVISIPGQPGIPSIGCPVGSPNCVTPPSYCTPGIPGYPNCAPPPWCQPGSPCVPPPGCVPTAPGYPYTGACAVAASQCKWFNPGTPVGNLIACRISWRQLR